MTFAAGYLASLLVFLVVDFAWLSAMAPRFYKPTMGDIALPGFNLGPAVAFYILYPVGLFIFAISPAIKSGSWTTALIYGSMFGFFTYATYDLTNHATLRNWTTSLTLVDIAWGTFLAGLAAVAGFLAAQRFAGG